MTGMATLLVRNVEDEIAQALRDQAQRHGCSVEEEHRRVLRAGLVRPRQRTFLEALATIPDVGCDEDFAREDGPHGRDRTAGNDADSVFFVDD